MNRKALRVLLVVVLVGLLGFGVLALGLREALRAEL